MRQRRFDFLKRGIALNLWRYFMANIGNLKKNSDGVFIGRIDTVAFSNVVALRPVISQNDAAPKYEVMALTPARTWAKVGAMFEQIKKDRKSTRLNSSH